MEDQACLIVDLERKREMIESGRKLATMLEEREGKRRLRSQSWTRRRDWPCT